jgi:hypothetical protein
MISDAPVPYMLSTPDLMQLDTQLLSVIESLQNALEVGNRATDAQCPTDADGAPFLDVVDGSADPSYPYAYGWVSSALQNALTDLHRIREGVTGYNVI